MASVYKRMGLRIIAFYATDIVRDKKYFYSRNSEYLYNEEERFFFSNKKIWYKQHLLTNDGKQMAIRHKKLCIQIAMLFSPNITQSMFQLDAVH